MTKVETDDGLHHGKFAESPEIVQLIGQRLIKGQTLTDSNISVGTGIAAVVAGTARGVGNVAATTLSAPVNIIENPRPTKKRPVVGDTLTEDQPKPVAIN